MYFKLFRRGSARCIGLLSAFVTILLCLYYISMGQSSTSMNENNSNNNNNNPNNNGNKENHRSHKFSAHQHNSVNNSWRNIIESGLNIIKTKDKNLELENDVYTTNPEWEKCVVLENSPTDITTVDEYAKFDFQPEWMKTKEYWDKSFESQYEKLKQNPERPQLKVIIVPHSHNDPGWLKTYVNYFQQETRQILNLIVTKMQEYKDMTFIWSEISFLQLWWDQAHPTKQRALRELVDSGRLEITTGGWVMTDEANVHLFAMVDQMIEGNQWLKTNLNYTPTVGWSIDPFGHGSTMPYLLSASDFEGTIIQRIHYAWKKWFAKEMAGDFIWSPYWQQNSNSKHRENTHSLHTHNMPFDIYSIKHSCGPHPFICLNFDFRKIPGEYTEYSIKAQFITDENIEAKADLLLEQYSRTASLFPHNVALIPVGDDFRYNKEREVEQQYTNYKKLIDFINLHKEKYKTEISFGTPRDYFKAIKERHKKFPTLKGDFFVYSDIFTEGRPAYWSGYFTTRPSYKLLSRDLENNLRSAEILFTIAFNLARQQNHMNALRIFEKNYEKMIIARRNLGLFQHHDAITGTSKANVMRDYGMRLFESIHDTVKMQESTIELLIQKNSKEHNFVLSEMEREAFNKIPRKMPITVTKDKPVEFVVFNSLANDRVELILLRSFTSKVKVYDPNGESIPIQINPVWNITDNYDSVNRKITASDKQFEIMFVANLPPLALITYTVKYDEENSSGKYATLYCNDCKEEKNEIFNVKNKQPGDIQLENFEMRLLFDEQTGFLKSVTKKNMGKPIQCAVKFAAYRSAQFHSGAYLLKTDPDHNDPEKDVLEQYSDMKIIITSGPLASDVTAIYGPFLAHTVRIFNTKSILDKAIFMENDIDLEPAPKNRETELFMRFVTDIENGDVPEVYTDLNSFQYQPRKKVPSIGIEGNYFPITSGAFIQDEKMRLSVITTHAQGAASLEPGQLELMVDRRTLYDDYRGMGEGIVDSKLTTHRYWILLESFESKSHSANNGGSVDGGGGGNGGETEYQLPSLLNNYLSNSLNYPTLLYYIENSSKYNFNLDLRRNQTFLKHKIPCDVHLMNLRTQTEPDLPLFPSNSALLVLHRQGFNCRLNKPDSVCSSEARNFQNKLFNEIHIETIQSTSLTGIKTHGTVTKFSDVYIEPMEVRTFNLVF